MTQKEDQTTLYKLAYAQGAAQALIDAGVNDQATLEKVAMDLAEDTENMHPAMSAILNQ